MTLNSKEVINNLIKDTEQIIHKIKQDVEGLSTSQLNWKPAPEKWSILECLEHLNRYGDYYLREFKDKIEAFPSGSKKSHYKTGWLGNYAAESILPKDGKLKKMKTFKNMDPANSVLQSTVVDEFMQQQQEMIRLLNEARQVDLGKIRIPITISRLIRFKLGDTLRFHIYHNVRHMRQIEGVLVLMKKEPNTV